MSIAQLDHPRRALRDSPAAFRITGPKAPLLLTWALLALVFYAAFAHGAVGATSEARLQVGIAAVCAVAAGAWLWTGALRVSAPRATYTGIGLLAAFAAWNGLTLLWSVAPDQTWVEFNRALTYVLVVCLGLLAGASHPRSLELVGRGLLSVVLVVTLYGLGQKLLPGVHIGGLLNLNQTGPLARLQEPFGYWNALALFVAMGVPLATAIAVDRLRSRRARIGALAALELMLLTLAFTYSRGGLLALVIGLVVGISLSKIMLRTLMWLGAACLASMPPLVVGLTNHSLTASGVSLGDREGAGLLLTAVVLASIAMLIVGARRLLELEWRVNLSAEQTRTVRRSLLSAAGVTAVLAVLIVSFSSRGLDGTISHAWKSFTTTRATSISDPHRLLSADSENRWVWWKEAAGAFSDRPIAGWGAGSFPVVHLLYRRDSLTVRQPHSVPLQWLAETGMIGTLPAIVGLALLLMVAVRATRRRPLSSERLLAAALVAVAATYAVHALYDWDWDIPGVTLPALLVLGVLAGSSSPLARARALRLPGPAAGTRTLALGGVTLALCLFALSVALPSLATSKANAAVVTADSSSPGALTRAQASASLAASLDPLSDAGLRVEATVALRRDQPRLARADLLNAVGRDPSDVQAWQSLAGVDLLLADLADARRTLQRVVALDPRSGASVAVSALIGLEQVPPKASPSAVATP